MFYLFTIKTFKLKIERIMKKVKLFLMTLVGVALLTACEKEKIITVEQLPVAAMTYVQKNYPDATVVYIKEETELFKTKYKVLLDNGLEIDFDKDGVPYDIDTDH